MSTRYSLPPTSDSTDTARGARILAAVLLVTCVLGLGLLPALAPDAAPSVAGAPHGESVPTPSMPLGA
jgi:hypothetical protein